MQIIQLELDHDNFFCPVNGQRITGSQSYEASPAQLGMWVDLVIDEPEINSPELEAKWQHYVEQLAEDDFTVMAEFFEAIDLPNHVCFEITTSGMACGPVSSTAWFVIDMDYCAPANE